MKIPEHIAVQIRRALSPLGASVKRVGEDWVEVSGASVKPGRHIAVYVRDPFDFDVQIHMPERRGSPFEQVIVGTPEEAQDIQATVVQFVADLVEERLVVAMDNRIFRGGHRFLTPSNMRKANLRHLSWVASWRGTFDSDNPPLDNVLQLKLCHGPRTSSRDTSLN